MPWSKLPKGEDLQKWLAEKRSSYTWGNLERDLALETWLDLPMARSVCARLKKLDLHPFDIKETAKMVIIPTDRASVLRMLDGVITLSLQAGARASLPPKET